MTRNVALNDHIDVFVSPLTAPHVLYTSRPLGLQEDHKGAYQTLVAAIQQGTSGVADVRAWFLAAAQMGAITHIAAFQGNGRFVFPLLLNLKSVRLQSMWPQELRSVELSSPDGLVRPEGLTLNRPPFDTLHATQAPQGE